MKEQVDKAVEALKAEKVILYPTDTIWGIGCDATNEQAVEKIYSIKKRDKEKSLIVLICNDMMLNKYVKDIPPLAWDIIDQANEPISIIYPNSQGIAQNALARDGSTAIRMVKDGFCKQLIHQFKRPIISSSANISGEKSPKNYADISAELKERVDYEVHLPSLQMMKSRASRIIKLSMNGEIQIIRM